MTSSSRDRPATAARSRKTCGRVSSEGPVSQVKPAAVLLGELAAGPVEAFEDHDVVAGGGQVDRGGEPTDPGADDRDGRHVSGPGSRPAR